MLACGLACCLAGCQGRAAGAGSSPAAPKAASPAFDSAFSQHWHDGKAELAGYDLVFPRYGELRRGTSVAIFVTEPFDSRTHIKPEDPKRGDVEVIKLNLVHDFPTGLYDYNLMTSAFVTTRQIGGRAAGSTLKVSFSAQEWCGHAYAQVRFDPGTVHFASHSYFEGEGDQSAELGYPEGQAVLALSEDALLLWARGLAGPALAKGSELEVPLLRSLERVRLQHVALLWDRVRLSREATTAVVEVPAGRFEVERLRATVRSAEGQPLVSWSFEVEAAHPRRVVRFERDDGLRASLRGQTRLPYWQLQRDGQQQLLRELGLQPRPEATP